MGITDDDNEQVEPDLYQQHLIQHKHDGTQWSHFRGKVIASKIAEDRGHLAVQCVKKIPATAKHTVSQLIIQENLCNSKNTQCPNS